MTKKDYIIVGKVLAQLRDYSAHCFDNDEDLTLIVDEFAKAFRKDNSKFNLMAFNSTINQELNRIFKQNL